MCGIIGAFDSQKILSEEAFLRLRDELTHRGPDDAGVYRDSELPVFLGHRRLSILDLSPLGRQPMGDPTGSFWLTFNGEIYNFKELRKELEEAGYAFKSQTDTEVILHGYRHWGEKVVERLQGMFAFCLYDRKKRIFFFARDRIGIKPFYYYHGPQGFFFASEIKPLSVLPGFVRALDLEALMDALSFGYIPAPKSIWKGIRKLPAAHFGVFSLDEGSLRLSPYWDFSFRGENEIDSEKWKQEIVSALDDSVASHLMSDVPLGAFLSGGFDSSMVVASMARQVPGKVKTFSIGFNEEAFNEAPLAKLLAERYGTEHHSETVDLSKVKERFEKVSDYFGEPFADSSSLPMDFLSEMTRRKVTVALSGDGGDELFGGYRRYLKMRYLQMGQAIQPLSWLGRRRAASQDFWKRQKGFIHEIGLPFEGAYASAMSKLPPEAVRRLLKPEILADCQDYDPFEKIQKLFEKAKDLGFGILGSMRYVDAKTWLPEDVLTKVDRVTMRHSLEARVPLLDHRFIERVQGIPEKILWGSRFRPELKSLFKAVARDFLPPEHFRQPKRGFGLPIREWFKNSLYNEMASVGLDSKSPFENGAVNQVLNLHRSGIKSFDEALWTLRSVEHWWRSQV